MAQAKFGCDFPERLEANDSIDHASNGGSFPSSGSANVTQGSEVSVVMTGPQ